MNKTNQILILKVGSNTDITDLKTSICEYLKRDGSVVMDSIGERAAYIGLRSIIFAQRQLSE